VIGEVHRRSAIGDRTNGSGRRGSCADRLIAQSVRPFADHPIRLEHHAIADRPIGDSCYSRRIQEYMMRRIPLLLVVIIGAAAMAIAQSQRQPVPMHAAAKALLSSLDEAQRTKATFAFDSEERFNWHFVPRERKGVSIKEMTPAQQKAALDLLRAGLSEQGYTKAEAVRSLEPVLFAIEKKPHRDEGLYFFSVFGQPAEKGTWGWRYEGHHISQNWTVVDGKGIASSPQFFGANPAEVRIDHPKKGSRALPAEEDLARALVTSMNEAQRKEAVLAAEAPSDILTANSRKAAIEGSSGIVVGSLNPKQQALLLSLIEEYAGVQPKAQSEARLAKIRSAGFTNIRFAWMGPIEKGQKHYYRVQGPTFLIEYDNVQNEGNHIHSVWRDFNGDFGVDLLAEHYRRDPIHVAARIATSKPVF
jgi:hypothetical protein